MPDLTAARVRELLSYDAATGRMTWAQKPSRNIRVGDEAGATDGEGYRIIRIEGQRYTIHRLAWLWVHGEWPTSQIDHRNGDRSDNRLVNLREATGAVNTQNQLRPQRRNKTGLLGVYFESRVKNQPWRSCIRADGKTVHLGKFDTPEQAHAAYLAAKRQFHPGCTL